MYLKRYELETNQMKGKDKCEQKGYQSMRFQGMLDQGKNAKMN